MAVTLKFNDDERGEENREFDEAMKRNPPVICPAFLTENGLFFLKPPPIDFIIEPAPTNEYPDEIKYFVNNV